MKLTLNQYYGLKSEMSKPFIKGSSYSTTDTNEIFISNGSEWVLSANLGLTEDQENDIIANKAKVSYPGDQDLSGIATNASDISTLDSSQGVQNTAIALNTAKVSYPGDQDLSSLQGQVSLTTNGTSGNATLVGDTLNIPSYTGGGSSFNQDLNTTNDVQFADTTFDKITIGTGGFGAGIQSDIDNSSTTLGTSYWFDTNRVLASSATDSYYGHYNRLAARPGPGITDYNLIGGFNFARYLGKGGGIEHGIYGSTSMVEYGAAGYDTDTYYGNIGNTANSNNGFMVGKKVEAGVHGTGVGYIGIMRVIDSRSVIKNPNITLSWVQGSHIQAGIEAGTVYQGIHAIFVDLDIAGGTIDGDVTHLLINDEGSQYNNATIGGEIRALWSQSTQPSLFKGTLSSKSWVSPVDTLATGTVAAVKGSNVITGNGTSFLTELGVGHKFRIHDKLFTVATITSDTSLTSTEVFNYRNGDDAFLNSALKLYIEENAFTVANASGDEVLSVDKSGKVSADSLELSNGLILESPNGTKYNVIVADDGTLSTTAV